MCPELMWRFESFAKKVLLTDLKIAKSFVPRIAWYWKNSVTTQSRPHGWVTCGTCEGGNVVQVGAFDGEFEEAVMHEKTKQRSNAFG